ncbi:hypothetical protein OsI_25662 [Oryza sativa Indica Group]|uniref:Uncharacterized protein n=1 Tax=Oryza sativa subsp. indica TaxID=39946 RepID=B8B576_ORYSI|nr:hypothetical protein OsI_25662 [Oryza sativa Indica Group]
MARAVCFSASGIGTWQGGAEPRTGTELFGTAGQHDAEVEEDGGDVRCRSGGPPLAQTLARILKQASETVLGIN